MGALQSNVHNAFPDVVSQHPFATGAALIGAWVMWKAVWNAYLSPIARQRIPGPRLAAASDLWNAWHSLRFDKVVAVHEAFKQYGPVVRIAPNHVMFNDAAAVQTIYATHDFKKGAWLAALGYQGTSNSLATTDPAHHAMYRRWTAPAFRGDNLRKIAKRVELEMDELVEHLKAECSPSLDHPDGRYVDVLPLLKRFYLDLVGIIALGTRFNLIASGEESIMAQLITDWLIDRVLVITLPRIFYNFLRLLPIPRLQTMFAADELTFKAAEEMYDNAPDKAPADFVSILSTCKAYRDPVTGEPAPKKEVIGEVTVFLTAGTDTAGVSSVFLCWCLAKSESVWSLLREEFAKVPPEHALEVDVLRNLAYLNAFIKEVLRLHGAGSTILERVTPPGGAMLAGYFIPGGTEVAGPAWSFHHHARLFPDPTKLEPERWVKRDANGTWVPRSDISPEVQAAWYPFGQGSRACVGRPLAEIELQMFTSTIVRNFRLHLHPTTTETSMGPFDAGVISPRSGKCLLRFEPVSLPTA